jgi:hypothetical protein
MEGRRDQQRVFSWRLDILISGSMSLEKYNVHITNTPNLECLIYSSSPQVLSASHRRY